MITTLVTPDTLLRGYRQLVARKYDGSQKRGPERPTIPVEIEQLVLRMAHDNPGWGYTRIQGAFHNLGHEIARNTVKRVLQENGLDPAGTRRNTWRTFIRAHWGAIAAADFFSVEVVTWQGLVRYFVLFVIDLKTRGVDIAGTPRRPDGEWMNQIARNLIDCEEGFLNGSRHLIHDRDPLFTTSFRAILKSSGIDAVKLPARSPNLNAYAERFVRSIKSECLAQIILLGEQHLRHAVKEYAEHDHVERNHQGLENELIDPRREDSREHGPVECRERLGGLLNYYSRAA